MPRKHKRKPGSRKYKDFDEDNMRRAIADVKSGTSIRISAKNWKVSKSTLYRRAKNIQSGKCGRPTVLKASDERELIYGLTIAAEWGFPLTGFDIRCIVKRYIDQKGVVEPRFRNNLPGPDWMYSFLHRHKGVLSTRLCENVKLSRAEVDENILRSYFSNLEKSIQGIPPHLIINYDETNLTDDPGRLKAIVRRGLRRPERVQDTSKSSTSVMFAGTASGALLPCYVVYKAEHLYNTWKQNGPKGTRYNRSKSGWFDGVIFEDWFHTIALKYFQRFDKEQPKILIGDNLASHISINVLNVCKEYNIRFVLLPPNSTHLCQPLDVAVFRPLKTYWRQILQTWKETHRGCIPKDTFPTLLNQTLHKLNKNIEHNLLSGFRATGIFPINGEEVLKRIPCKNENNQPAGTDPLWGEAFASMLSMKRVNENAEKRRKQKLNVKPGLSLGASDKSSSEDESPESDHFSLHDSDSSVGPEDFGSIEGEEFEHSQLNFESFKNREEPQSSTESKRLVGKKNEKIASMEEIQEEVPNENDIIIKDFVVCKFLFEVPRKKTVKKYFIGLVEGIDCEPKKFHCNFLRKNTKNNRYFVFPNIVDRCIVDGKTIVKILKDVQVSRGRYSFKELQNRTDWLQ